MLSLKTFLFNPRTDNLIQGEIIGLEQQLEETRTLTGRPGLLEFFSKR